MPDTAAASPGTAAELHYSAELLQQKQEITRQLT
jgi:hypothetical protein